MTFRFKELFWGGLFFAFIISPFANRIFQEFFTNFSRIFFSNQIHQTYNHEILKKNLVKFLLNNLGLKKSEKKRSLESNENKIKECKLPTCFDLVHETMCNISYSPCIDCMDIRFQKFKYCNQLTVGAFNFKN